MSSARVDAGGGRTRSPATQLLLNQQFFHCAKSIENKPTAFLENGGRVSADT